MPVRARSLALALGAVVGTIGSLPSAGAGGATPDDPVFEQDLQWGLTRIGAPQAWAGGRGDGVTIAVIDSGIDLTHEELRPQLAGHVSCIGADGDPVHCTGSGQDDNGHGTHVAGIAAAATDNGRGIAGVAPDAEILAVRVLANSCDGTGACTATGSASDVAAGIRWAADRGADVINLSLGGGTLQSTLGCAFCDAVEYAWSKGAIAVVAAGNDSVLPAGFGDEHAVIVTATTRTDGRASYSNTSSGLLRQARWPVAAPGGEAETDPDDCATGGAPKGVLSTYWITGHRNEYACQAGTSMATPHVAGALAVLLSTGRSPQAAIDRLLTTAQDLGPAGRDDQFGVGRIDLRRAVGIATPPPSATTTAPGGSSTTTDRPSSSTVSTAGTAPGEATTTGPSVSLPEMAAPAPYSPTPPSDGDDPPPWLVGIAIAAVLVTGAGTVTAARRGARPPASL